MGSPFIGGNPPGGAGAFETVVVGDSPVVYYPNPGNGKDKSGNGNGATSKGSVQTGIKSGLFPCSKGNKDSSINITASGDGIISNSSATAPTGDFTIEAFVTAPKTIDAQGLILFGMAKEAGDAGGGRRCVLAIESTGIPQLKFLDTGGTFVNANGTGGLEIDANNSDHDNQVWHIVATYTKSTGQVKIYRNGGTTAGARGGNTSTVNTGNTNGVMAVGTDDIRWCVGDIPSSADSDVMSGIYGATQARIHDVAFYNEALTEADAVAHFNAARIPCSGSHPLVYKINEYNPIFWATMDDDGDDQISGATGTVSGATFEAQTGLKYGDTSKSIYFGNSTTDRITWDGATIDSKLANFWTNGTSRRVCMAILNSDTISSATSAHLFGSADSAQDEGWNINKGGGTTSLNLRQRNTGSEEFFGNISLSGYGSWYFCQWRYYEQLNESGMNWRNSGYYAANVTNGGNSADATGNDFWAGDLSGGPLQGMPMYMQHLCFFDQDMEDYIMIDFYNAWDYDGDVSL